MNLTSKRGSILRYATQMSIIRCMLLKKYPDAIETFGYVTKANRENLGLKKDHYIDACVIASGGLEFEPSDVLYQKRCVPAQSRKLARGARGEIMLPTGKVHGFKRYDKVEYLGKVFFIKLRRIRGGFTLMDIDSNNIDFRDIGGKCYPSHKYFKRIGARKSVLCIPQRMRRE